MVLVRFVPNADSAFSKGSVSHPVSLASEPRIHRAGENAPYTGLKPAGRDLGPAIPAADKALETGSDVALVELLTGKVQDALRSHFKEVTEKKNFAPDDVAAGRGYVEAYVAYIHYVERLYEAAKKQASGHYAETK